MSHDYEDEKNPYSSDPVTNFVEQAPKDGPTEFVQNRKERRAEEKRSRRMDSELRKGAIRQNENLRKNLRAAGIKKRLEARAKK